MKTTIRRLAHILLDDSYNNTQAGHATSLHRDTIRKMRQKLSEASVTRDGFNSLTDQHLASILMPPKNRATTCLEPDWNALLQHILSTSDNLLDTYEVIYLKLPLNMPRERHMSYSSFCRKMRAILKRRAPEYRHYYQPGEVAQIDFAGFQPTYISSAGKAVKCTLLIMNLPFSQLCEAHVVRSQSREDTIHGLIKIFERIGDTPKRMIFDNFKAAVTTARRSNSAAKINPEFLAFLDHYNILPDAARARKPTDKGAVEASVRIIQNYYRRLLREERPRSTHDLNRILEKAMQIINQREMRRWKMSRRKRFEDSEQNLLGELPTSHYEYGKWHVDIKVPLHYHISIDDNEYSVPFSLIGKLVNVKATATHIEIYNQGTIVSIHPRATCPHKGSGRSTLREHMPVAHQAMEQMTAPMIIARARQYSPIVGQFIEEHLLAHKNTSAARNMLNRFISSPALKSKIDDACAEAIRRGQINAEAVRQIMLRGEAAQLVLSQQKIIVPSANIRGAGYYSSEVDDAQ